MADAAGLDSVAMIIQQWTSADNLGPIMEGIHAESTQDQCLALDALKKLREGYSYYGPTYFKDDYQSVLRLIAKGLEDTSPDVRKLSLEITSEFLPGLQTGGEIEQLVTEEIVPRLVFNLCFSNTAIKKSTVQTLHVYMRHFNRVQDVLGVIIKQLENSDDAKTRTELMVALPIIITPAFFAQEDIFELIGALVHRLEVSSVKSEHNAPSMVCLERIKSVFGENVFMSNINRLPERLQKEYNLGLQKYVLAGQGAANIEKQTSLHSFIAKSLSNGSINSNNAPGNTKINSQGNAKKGSQLAKSTSGLDKVGLIKPVSSAERVGLVRARSTERLSKGKHYSDRLKKVVAVENVSSENNQTLHHGFIPAETMAELGDSNWKSRAHGIEELKVLVESICDSSVLLSNLGDFLEMLSRFIEDPNFKVLLTSLYILRDVVEKVGENMRPHMELILNIVQTKLGDSKSVIKQLNMQLVLRVMHFAKPWAVLKPLMPNLNHRNSKVREDVINMITAAMLTFPSSDFKLATLPSLISHLLVDPKRKVRQAVLECYAVIAQGLGPGRMQPLVSSVDMIELNPEGEGVMEAVQARLARRKLPKLNVEGTVEYSMIVTNASKHSLLSIPPDVSWIIHGSSGANGDLGKSHTEGMTKRYRSAGKKRLPWEVDDEIANGPLRKSVGSAPVHHHEEKEGDLSPYATRNSWASGQNGNASLDKVHIKAMLGSMPMKQQDNLEFVKNDTASSYFHMYKQRMRKLKQAGLQADHNIINTLTRTTPLSTADDKGQLIRRNSIGKESMRTPASGSRSPVAPLEDKQLSASWSGSELVDLWHVAKKPTDLEPIGAPITENEPLRDMESPVHTRPAVVRSASKKRRQQRADSGKISPIKLDDTEEQGKKKKPPTDPLANIRQQAAFLKQQKIGAESKQLNSPFDSRPKIARSPSARKSKQSQISEKLSSDTSESGKESPSPRENPGIVNRTNGEAKSSSRRSSSPVAFQKGDYTEEISHHMNETNETIESNLTKDSLEYEEDFETVDSEVMRDDTTNSSSDEQNNSDEHSPENIKGNQYEKAHSGLSRSALERVQKRKHEELQKRELSLIRQRERETEERLKAGEEGRAAEERKQAELNRKKAEMKRIEDLLKAEELKKEEQLLQKKLKEEEEQRKQDEKHRQEEKRKQDEKRKQEEKRRENELQAKREQQARQDEEEMRRAEDDLRQKEMNRREQRMKDLEDLIEVEEKRQDDIRKLKEEMRRQEEIKQWKLDEENRKKEDEEFKIQEENRKKAEAESKEAKRKKAELRRIKEHKLLQEIKAKEEEEKREKLKMMSNRLDPVTQQDQDGKYDAFQVNYGECERGNATNDNEHEDDANNNYVKPPSSRSPKVRRKVPNGNGRAFSGSYTTTPSVTNSVVRRSFTEGNMGVEHLSPCGNPEHALKDALRQFGSSSEDWEIKCDGLQTLRRLAVHHPDVLVHQLHNVCLAVTAEARNLRSQVSRNAIQCLGEIITYLPKPMEPELDLTISTLLSKSGESNAFIKEDVEASLLAIVKHVSSVKAMGAFINGGAGHRNAQVRKMCARILSKIAEKMGAGRLLSGSKDVTDRILPVAAQFAVDGQQETRYYGRCILFLMIEHPDLDRLIEKHLPKANVRPAKDIIETLKSKGLRDAPTEHGSASVRRSQRNAASGHVLKSVARSTTFSGNRSQVDGRNGSGSKASLRASTHKASRQMSQTDGYQPAKPLDLDSIAGLDANEWKTRSEAIELFYELIRTNSEGVIGHISKVFDKFIPRLTDSNSKVNLQALQTMNKVVPILRDSLAPLITMLMQSLTSSVASKSNSIYNAAMEVLISFTKFVDNVLLLQPLIAAVRYGNTRVKPEMAMRLADLVTPIFQRKPNLVQTHILPVLWHLLSTSKGGSAANSRNDINTATAKLCEELYICYGESLYDEAESQGRQIKEKLRHYMM